MGKKILYLLKANDQNFGSLTTPYASIHPLENEVVLMKKGCRKNLENEQLRLLEE